MQLGTAKIESGTNPLLPFEARRSQHTRLCPFSHVSQMETLWTGKGKRVLREPTAVGHAASGQSRTHRTISRLYCRQNHHGVGHPLAFPAARWDLPQSAPKK